MERMQNEPIPLHAEHTENNSELLEYLHGLSWKIPRESIKLNQQNYIKMLTLFVETIPDVSQEECVSEIIESANRINRFNTMRFHRQFSLERRKFKLQVTHENDINTKLWKRFVKKVRKLPEYQTVKRDILAIIIDKLQNDVDVSDFYNNLNLGLHAADLYPTEPPKKKRKIHNICMINLGLY